MNTHDASWNPTAAAATANEGHEWPGSRPGFKGDLTGRDPETAQVQLGGQAPMFIHDDVTDLGLVRLGGQSPMFQVSYQPDTVISIID